MYRYSIIPALVLLTGTVMAQSDEPPDTDAPEPPPMREPMPPKVQDSDEQIEPAVVIRKEDGQTVEEYYSGGTIYMIRVVPEIGLPYYLIDTTGDGNFDSRHDHMDPVKPAHWKVIEW